MTAALLLTTVFFSATTAAGESKGENISTDTTAPPLTAPQYTARLAATQLHGRAGTPLSILLTITPHSPPPGFFYTSVVDILEAPPGQAAEIVSGAREILVNCFMAGSYRLRIRVNLINKYSCGGADAEILIEEEVLLDIAD